MAQLAQLWIFAIGKVYWVKLAVVYTIHNTFYVTKMSSFKPHLTQLFTNIPSKGQNIQIWTWASGNHFKVYGYMNNDVIMTYLRMTSDREITYIHWGTHNGSSHLCSHKLHTYTGTCLGTHWYLVSTSNKKKYGYFCFVLSSLNDDELK